jgi:hypothetical protein
MGYTWFMNPSFVTPEPHLSPPPRTKQNAGHAPAVTPTPTAINGKDEELD